MIPDQRAALAPRPRARTSSLRLVFSLVAVEAAARTATARRLRPPATGLAAKAVGTATLLAHCIV